MKNQRHTERQLMNQLLAAAKEQPKKRPEKIKPRRTIKSILWEKYLDRVESDGTTPIYMAIIKPVLFVLIASWLVYPETVGELLKTALEWRGFLILKIIASGFLISHLETVARVCYYVAKIITKIIATVFKMVPKFELNQRPKSEPQILCINEIPHNELITHLLETGNFKRSEIETKFSIPRRKYESLAKALEKLGIIQKDKDQNNAFMFVPQFTRQDLANILDGKTDAKDLENFTKQIERTVLLSPTPNFTRTAIS